MRRFVFVSLICAAFAAAPAATSAAPPAPPPGCFVVPGTPASVTGSDVGFNQKQVTYARLCPTG